MSTNNEGMTRRGFVAAAVATGAACCAASGVASAAEELKNPLTPGTYTAEGYGKWPKGSIEGARYGSPAVIEPTIVEVTVDESSIVDVKILQSSDTPDLVAPVVENLPASIIANQSVNADVIAGCTLTSACVLRLVADCLEQAGADPSDFKAIPEKVDASESYDVDQIGRAHV